MPSRVRLFLRGAIQVALVSSQVYLIANRHWIGVAAIGFAISYVWSHNVKSVVFGTEVDRIVYSMGAACGTGATRMKNPGVAAGAGEWSGLGPAAQLADLVPLPSRSVDTDNLAADVRAVDLADSADLRYVVAGGLAVNDDRPFSAHTLSLPRRWAEPIATRTNREIAVRLTGVLIPHDDSSLDSCESVGAELLPLLPCFRLRLPIGVGLELCAVEVRGRVRYEVPRPRALRPVGDPVGIDGDGEFAHLGLDAHRRVHFPRAAGFRNAPHDSSSITSSRRATYFRPRLTNYSKRVFRKVRVGQRPPRKQAAGIVGMRKKIFLEKYLTGYHRGIDRSVDCNNRDGGIVNAIFTGRFRSPAVIGMAATMAVFGGG